MVTEGGADLALEFLNTLVRVGSPASEERIPDGAHLLGWLESTRALSDEEVRALRRRFGTADLDAVAATARDLRECLRAAVAGWAKRGALPSDPLVGRLNALLAAAPRTASVRVAGRSVVVEEARRLDAPIALLAPVAEAFADLFARGVRGLVRPCAADDCSIWFYDRTKAHRRRWCSMTACGAREKARAYRRRQARAGASRD
jgi:predicted RNA-binding Zn ribbon-like protein